MDGLNGRDNRNRRQTNAPHRPKLISANPNCEKDIHLYLVENSLK